MKKIVWKRDAVVSVKVGSHRFMLAQMLDSPVMCFFKLTSCDGSWDELVLKESDVLFCVFVGDVVLKTLCVGYVEEKTVKPMKGFRQKLWIRTRLNMGGGYPFKGGDLIEIDFDTSKGASASPVVKANLTHRDEEVGRFELTNMWGAEDLADRLNAYIETGVDENVTKKIIFGM